MTNDTANTVAPPGRKPDQLSPCSFPAIWAWRGWHELTVSIPAAICMSETLAALETTLVHTSPAISVAGPFSEWFPQVINTYSRKEHRDHMTTEQKRKSNQRFWEKKRAEGWRFFGFVLPPVVAKKVREFKRREMAKYRDRVEA